MNLIQESEIDFDAYMEEHPEHAQIIPAVNYTAIVQDYFYGERSTQGTLLPWAKTHGNINLAPGNVSLWAGINGHGKSTLLGEIILGAMTQDKTACIASFEMRPEATLAKINRQAAGTNRPSKEFIFSFHDWTDNRLWMYDQYGTIKPERMLAVIRCCAEGVMHAGKKVKIDHFVIDSLLKCGLKVDDYNGQKNFVDHLCAISKYSGMHIHLLHHIRKGISETSVPDKFDIKGAGEITDLVDNVFVFWRNKPKEKDAQKPTPSLEKAQEPDALLMCSKQRHGEWEGTVGLWFDKASLQYMGSNKGIIPFVEYQNGIVMTG